MEDTRNPAVTYLPRHAATRNTIGRRPLPWSRTSDAEVDVAIDVSVPDDIVLMLTGDHDATHITLTRATLERLHERIEIALDLTDPDIDPTPVEQWEVTEGVTVRERLERAMAVAREAGRVA